MSDYAKKMEEKTLEIAMLNTLSAEKDKEMERLEINMQESSLLVEDKIREVSSAATELDEIKNNSSMVQEELEGKVKEMEECLSEKDSELSTARQNLEEAKLAIETSKETINVLSAELDELKKGKESLEEEIVQKSNAMTAFEEDLSKSSTEKDAAIKTLKEQLANLENEKKELVDAQKEFKKKVSKNFKEKLSEMSEKEKALTLELEEERSAVSTLKENLESKDAELTSLNESLSESNQKSEDLSTHNTSLQTEVESMSDKVSELTAELEKSCKESEDLKARLEHFMDSTVTNEMSQLLEEKEKTIENLNEKLLSARKLIDDLSSKIHLSPNENNFTVPEIPIFEEVDNNDSIIVPQVEEICVPVLDNVEVMAENDEFLNHLDEGIDDTDSKQLLNETSVDQSAYNVDERDELIQELQNKVSELENECIVIGESSLSQLTNLNNDVNMLSEKVAEQEIYLGKVEKENEQLQQNLSLKEAIVVQLESQLEMLSNDETVLDSTKSNELVLSLQKDLSFRKRVIATMDADVKSLKDELHDSENKIKEMDKASKVLQTKIEILSEKLCMKTEKNTERENELLLEIQNVKNEIIFLKENTKSNEMFDSETTKRDQKMIVLQERLKMKTSDLEEVQQVYNSAVKSWEDEKEMLEANCAACHQEFVDLKTEHVNSQSQWLDKEAGLNSQIGDLSCELSLLKKEKDDLEMFSLNQQTSLQSNISSLENQCQSLNDRETELQNELREFVERFEKEKDAKEDLLIQLNAMKDALSKTSHENADMEDIRVELQKALGDLALRKKLVVSMEKEMQELKKQLVVKDEELSSMTSNDEPEEEIESNGFLSHDDEAKLRKEIEHLTATLIRAETKASNAIMETKIKEDTMKLREDNYKQQAFCLQSEIQDQHSQIEHLQGELQKVQFALLCTEKEKETLLRENRENLQAVDNKLKAVHQQLANESGKVEELKTKETEKEQLAQEKKREVLKRLEEVLPDEQDMSELKELVSTLAQQIAAQEIDIKGRKKMVSINDQMLTQSKEEVNELKGQLSVLQSDLESAHKELETKNMELKQAQDSLEVMQTNLAPIVVEDMPTVVENMLQTGPLYTTSPPVTEDFIDQVYETETHAPAYDLTSYDHQNEEYTNVEGDGFVGDDEDGESIQDEFQKYIDMVEELQMKQLESEEKHNRLEKDKAILQEQLQQLMKKKEDLEQQIVASEQKIREYERLVMKFAEETDEAKGVVGSITYQRDLLHNDLYQLQQNFSWREKELSDQLVTKQNELNALHENVNGLHHNINTLQADKERELTQKDEIINGFTQQTSSFEKEILEKQQNINDLKQILQDKEENVRNLQNDVVRLTQMTMDQNKTNEEISNQLHLTASELGRTKDELAQHRAMYAQNIQALQQCFEEVSQNTGQMEKQLEDAQSKHKGWCVVYIFFIYLQTLSLSLPSPPCHLVTNQMHHTF